MPWYLARFPSERAKKEEQPITAAKEADKANAAVKNRHTTQTRIHTIYAKGDKSSIIDLTFVDFRLIGD